MSATADIYGFEPFPEKPNNVVYGRFPPINPTPAAVELTPKPLSGPVNAPPATKVPQGYAAGQALFGATEAIGTAASGGGLFETVASGLGGAVGGLYGAMAGGAAGGAAGGSLGTATLPIVGTVSGATVGAVAGEIAGGIAGAQLGSSVAASAGKQLDQSIGQALPGKPDWVPSWLWPGENIEPEPNVVTQSSNGPPPFQGGQSAGVWYKVTATGHTSLPISYYGVLTQNVLGPITKIEQYEASQNSWYGTPYWTKCLIIYAANGTWTTGYRSYFSQAGSPGIAIERMDGAPDTGGNLPGPLIDVPVVNPAISSVDPPTLGESRKNKGVDNPIPLGAGLANPPGVTLPGYKPPQADPDNWPNTEPATIPGSQPLTPEQPIDNPSFSPDNLPGSEPLQEPVTNPQQSPDPFNPGESNPLVNPVTTGIGIAIGVGTAIALIPKLIPQSPVKTPIELKPGAKPQVHTPGDPLISKNPADNPLIQLVPDVVEQTGNKPTPACRYNSSIESPIFSTNSQAMNPTTGFAGLYAVGIETRTTLGTLKAFLEKAWETTRLQKVINALTLIGVLHNAAMISRDVGETMGYALSNGLAAIGIKDEEGGALDINQIVGDTVSNLFKTILGEDTYNGLSTTWNKANTIIRSASNIAWTIRSIQDGAQEVLEWTAENTGKIGNALKKYGVVGERAYPWMAERVRAQDAWRRKFGRILDGLEQAEDTASSFAMVTSEVREIQDEIDELSEQRQIFKDAVRDLAPGRDVDNSDIPANNDEAITNAQAGPEITSQDMERNSDGTP